MINEPIECNRFLQIITDPNKNEIYRMDINYNQCGVGCRGSAFGKCYEVFFPIFKPDNPSRHIDAADAYIHKRHTACKEEPFIENPEAVEIVFPRSAKSNEKFIILLLGILIDYKFYEDNPLEVTAEPELD
jgi:hypothetical protein